MLMKLFRYDSNVDKQLKNFMKMIPKLNLLLEVTWVAGNTLVLKFGQRASKAPFQVDAPRLVDAKKFGCKKGCFQASLDKKGQLVLEPNDNCLEKLPYICGYDNVVNYDYDPLDYKFIEKEMTHDEAVVECNKLKRPLASLRTLDQVNKARKVIQWRKKHVWISAIYDKANRAYKWEDGSYLSYRNWEHTIPQNFKAFREHNCASVWGGNGKWHTQICSKKLMVLCGPKEENQCTELQKLHAPACSGGQVCSPAPNHYHCRCPPGFIFKFTGVCNKKEFLDRPNFDIYTIQVPCANVHHKDGTCIKEVEVRLRNIPISFPCGYEKKENFVFKVKARDNMYQLNGKNITDQVSVKEDAYKAVTKQSYFSLVVYSLDMKVILNGNHLRVRIADKFRGKLCGLCGDCGTDKFKLRNGTIVALPLAEGKVYKKNDFKPIGVDWMVQSDEFKNKKCGVSDIVDNCTGTQKKKVADKGLCGIFKEQNNALKKCFDAMGNKAWSSREKYFTDCVYDVCEMGDPSKAVCGVLEAFAQECAAKGVLLNWRRPDFCPMKCGPSKVYRADASCQRECGSISGKNGACDEEPAEGCVCKDGLYLLGEKCVPKCQCGCRVTDIHGNFVTNLQPKQSAIMPGCKEKVECETKIDGSLARKYIDFVMPPNSVCTDDTPPKIVCARGYQKPANSKTCQRKPGGCKNGYTDTYGVCIQERQEKTVWNKAASTCSGLGGTLLYMDTAEKIKTAKKILKAKKWKSMYVTGQVKAISTHGFVTFKPVTSKSKEGSTQWANDHFYTAFLDKVSLISCLKGKVPKEGLILNVIADLDQDEVTFKAVPPKTTMNFVCEQL
ncbi:zonadhesin [Plakobranchus ocellatus]|uniref:Zonadhesin n=1 Tax=Plakobranchus ocellatus TaxID=259542 RepID=A0AAV3ZXF2_9GAST|nr:zonadhesin [Plakobranchus ocellatus]